MTQAMVDMGRDAFAPDDDMDVDDLRALFRANTQDLQDPTTLSWQAFPVRTQFCVYRTWRLVLS